MGFTSVTYKKDMGMIAAQVNRHTGELSLNDEIFPHLPPYLQRFIELHELGHIVHQTDDEETANLFAYEQMLSDGDYAETTLRILDIEIMLQEKNVKKYCDNLEKGKYESNIVPIVVAGIIAAVAAVAGSTTSIFVSKRNREAAEKLAKQQQEAQQKAYEKQRLSGLGSLVDTIFATENYETEAAQKAQKTTRLLTIALVSAIALVVVFLLIKKLKAA